MQANPEMREESTKYLCCKGHVIAKSTAKFLPKEKLGTRMSAGLSEDPKIMKGYSLIGAQAAKEENRKIESLIAL